MSTKLTKANLNFELSKLDINRELLLKELETLEINEAIIKHNLEETKNSLDRLEKLEKLSKELFEHHPSLELGGKE